VTSTLRQLKFEIYPPNIFCKSRRTIEEY